MTTAVERRRFDVERDARRGVYLADGERLYEVVGTRGFDPKGERPPEARAALKLLDCRPDLPMDPFVELEMAAWVPVAEVAVLAIVEPAGA